MPKPLERKLEKEYKNLPKKERNHAVYGTMNKLGMMHGNKETKKGEAIEHALKKKMSSKMKNQ